MLRPFGMFMYPHINHRIFCGDYGQYLPQDQHKLPFCLRFSLLLSFVFLISWLAGYAVPDKIRSACCIKCGIHVRFYASWWYGKGNRKGNQVSRLLYIASFLALQEASQAGKDMKVFWGSLAGFCQVPCSCIFIKTHHVMLLPPCGNLLLGGVVFIMWKNQVFFSSQEWRGD